MSTERVILPLSLKDKFIEALTEQMYQSWYYPRPVESHAKANEQGAEGDAKATAPKMQNLYQSTSARRINGLVQEAIQMGAQALPLSSSYTPPTESQLSHGQHPLTILTSITPQMPIWHTETFGPILILLTIDDTSTSLSSDELDQKMVEMANDTEYGLAGSVYTRDVGRGIKVGRRMDCGLVRVNRGTVGDDPVIPFGEFEGCSLFSSLSRA